MRYGARTDGEHWPETSTPHKSGKRCRRRRIDAVFSNLNVSAKDASIHTLAQTIRILEQ